MKTKDFVWQFRQNRLLMFFASTLFVLFSVLQTTAQPGGCYNDTWRHEYCREQRNALLEKYGLEIENLDRQIAHEPNNAAHYYQRGQVYSAMMSLRLSGARDVEFDGKVYFADIDTKAIEDYERAIQLAPKNEYFVERGKIYMSQWQRGTSNFQYVRRDEKNTDEEIRQTIDKLFIYNEDFQAAERDFLKAIELSNDYERSKTARERLFSLRSWRANSLDLNESIARLIGAGKLADIALADLDHAIDFYRFYLANNEPNDTVKRLLYGAWIRKGVAAKRFGRDDIALDAFSEAEKVQVKNSFPDCALYHNRAEIFSKRTNYEAALKDVTFAIENNPNCKRMSELRGDIYLLKGDLTAAIDSYSTILNDGNGYNRDIYWKRGKLYLETSEAQKAVDDFTAAIGSSSLCERDYELRARAFRLAGDMQAAEADEERARQAVKNQKSYTGSEYCHYHKQ